MPVHCFRNLPWRSKISIRLFSRSADVDALIFVDQNCVRQIELSRLIAIAAPRF
jgi:hypothetical protein